MKFIKAVLFFIFSGISIISFADPYIVTGQIEYPSKWATTYKKLWFNVSSEGSLPIPPCDPTATSCFAPYSLDLGKVGTHSFYIEVLTNDDTFKYPHPCDFLGWINDKGEFQAKSVKLDYYFPGKCEVTSFGPYTANFKVSMSN